LGNGKADTRMKSDFILRTNRGKLLQKEVEAFVNRIKEMNFLLSQQNLPRRTHKLIELLALCSEIDCDFRGFEEQCLELDRYYLPTRYPDAIIGTLPEGLPGRKEGESTLEIATGILEFVKGKLKT
jgi:HEPN domain-containing protein